MGVAVRWNYRPLCRIWIFLLIAMGVVTFLLLLREQWLFFYFIIIIILPIERIFFFVAVRKVGAIHLRQTS